MKIELEVKDESEGLAIQTALADPVVRASVVITGILLPQTENARERILGFVQHQITNP